MPSRGNAKRGRSGRGGGASGNSSSTTSYGQGSKVQVDVCESNTARLATFVKNQSQLTHVDDTISIFKEIVPMKFRGKALTLATGSTILDWNPDSDKTPNQGTLTLQEGTLVRTVQTYKKMIALQDVYRWMRYNEQPLRPFNWSLQNPSVLAPENQGYIDVLASALVSKVASAIVSPHFCKFYGAFRAVCDVFRYNLEDDIEDFRFSKWFWKSLDSGNFTICVTEKSTGKQLSYEELQEYLRPDEEYLHDEDDEDEDDDSDSDTTNDGTLTDSSLDAEVLDDELNLTGFDHVPSIGLLEESTGVELEESHDPTSSTSIRQTKSSMSHGSVSSVTSEMSFTEDYTIQAEFKSMPVVVMYLEKLHSTMDSLLEQSVYSPIHTKEQEQWWSAWLFQICVALTQLQNILHLTHNDLHTNNILWKPTDIEFLWYKDSKGAIWRVPTYGKLFSIIDYGRAIFTMNGHTCISSDYDDGHDAAGMYNFGPIKDHDAPHVPPNKSFDLCRLSCSMLRALYPRNPDSLPKGAILTKEPGWEVRETAQPIFNILWTWIRTKDRSNVLETQFGKERYPGFELYTAIAIETRDAVPEKQFADPVFKSFIWTGTVSTDIKYVPF